MPQNFSLLHSLSSILGDYGISSLLDVTYAWTSVVYNAVFLAFVILGALVISVN